MEDARTRITFSGINPPHSTSRLIERHVLKWIDRERTLLFLPNQASFSVHIDREGYRYYTCHIEIQIGSREWNGLEEGRSLHEAVLNTLKSMKPKERVELPRRSPFSAPLEATA